MAKAPAKLNWQQLLKSGDRIFIGSHAGTPAALIDDLIANAKQLHDIEIVQVYTLADNKWVEPQHQQLFKVNALFIGGDKVRQAVAEGRADYTPCFMSDIPSLFSDGVLPLDAALIMVSPADQHGYHSLGVSVDVVSAAAKSAKKVIAQVNPAMPVTYGQAFIHRDQIDSFFYADQPLPEMPAPELDAITERIGQYVSLLIEDGATIQIGIGKICDAVLRYLGNHKDLGVHSELITDGVMDLIKKGVVNNRKKTFHPGKTVTSFCVGSRALYDFVHANPHLGFYPSEYVNSPTNIARNDNMVAINSAIEVDLTGQIVSDSIGHLFYSGIGGQVDFSRGASMSSGGKPIIALPSTAQNGTISRIVPFISEGAGVVTSRGHVHYVVTEFGVASLRGKSIRERSLELIRVAHPKFRQQLLEEVRKHYWVPHYQLHTPMEVPELGDVGFKELLIDGEEFDLRPLNPSDERRLQEFFYSHTKETLQLRYSAVPTQMSREKSCTLVGVDQSRDLALCIVKQKGSAVQIQAVGRYYLLNDNQSCEVAFVTREKHQGKGMAKRLLQEMITIAELRGLTSMSAYVRSENKAMLAVFQKAGFSRLPGDEPTEVNLQLRLPRSAGSKPAEHN
ncbi:bifunctional acetyl-CoA hydrolase/transferase family protein/GNAT family N-acetyltransferase [Rheinheimera sp. EpRS3]|uniref:bifunctional acetyl-CoA hydrolase/transferase family protein/GNAT family N-acetyltransferase n=1 Tax=Rheinheimera sp. EpRS3 TaxID=1712383 RepID=UPI0007477736|nr:bifunctional acetyl-CoA hydrolase/transferase family protein/GNAT family N-acetyltransferase [Rheinheimera sp. EpRS3]KUM54366.1 4-hydroxybutyrate CoA-transferase [Rheinheimera sp. EpRS3]